MTQLRKDPDSISNHFDKLLDGIGHRGSSLGDIDRFDVVGPPIWLTHDKKTRRFLFQEFKYEHELLSKGQRRSLVDLARLSSVNVWIVVLRKDLLIGWHDIKLSRGAKKMDLIDGLSYQERFRRWWKGEPILPGVPEKITMDELIKLGEQVRWGL